MTVWLVEDNEDIRELVAYTLQASGYEVRAFEAAAPLYEALKTDAVPALFLLDIMLPEEDGLSILKKLRVREDTAATPIIMLTAKGEEYDKVLGLDAGADDYVTKPFGMMELLSRIRAVLRRAGIHTEAPKTVELRCGPLALNGQKRTVHLNDTPLTLTLKEFELLRQLMENPGVVLTRDVLLDSVWGYRYEGGTRTVDVHVRSLRHKLGDYADLIQTVRGVGYKLGDNL